MSECPFHWDANLPEHLRWLAITANFPAWRRVRKMAARHSLTVEESRGFLSRRFLVSGESAGLNGFADELWNDSLLGPPFQAKCKEVGLT